MKSYGERTSFWFYFIGFSYVFCAMSKNYFSEWKEREKERKLYYNLIHHNMFERFSVHLFDSRSLMFFIFDLVADTRATRGEDLESTELSKWRTAGDFSAAKLPKQQP